jgi:hypothetical protein
MLDQATLIVVVEVAVALRISGAAGNAGVVALSEFDAYNSSAFFQT